MTSNVTTNHVFVPYRALGLVASSVPFALERKGTQDFVTVCSGYSWQLYNCEKLRLLMVGSEHEKKIKALVTHKEFVYTASGMNIFVWKRGKLLNTLLGHNTSVTLLRIFGEHLLSLDKSGILKIWNLITGEFFDELEFPRSLTITTLEHPHTYLNKILIGTEQGVVQLWNIRTKKVIYSFKSWKSSINAIEQSPAVDVVAIALENGTIVIHNLKLDREICRFTHSVGGVTSVSFRSDGPPVLVSGTRSGQIAVWDLEKQKLLGLMNDVHEGSITRLSFLHGQPVLVTGGVDNSIKMWIFDNPSLEVGRLLRSRSGHSQPPQFVRFYNSEQGHHILSSGVDQALRFSSTIQEHQNRELSQGARLANKAIKKKVTLQSLKLPPVLSFDSNSVKEREWDNILTCHKNDRRAFTWSFEKLALGKHTLISCDPCTSSHISSVLVSACGNFGFLGTSQGWIDKYNLQSGQHRGSCTRVHTKGIQGLASDALNRFLISGSLDGTIIFWNFQTLREVGRINVAVPITRMILNRDSDLLAVLCDDFVIRVYDIETQRLVRRFRGHDNQLTDLSFSPDGRWLVSSSMDHTIRVWDLPSGRMIDWFRVNNAVTSLSFSPTGDYLTTTHVDRLGIYLWVNQAHFVNVVLNPVASNPETLGLPTVTGVEEKTEEEEGEGEEAGEENGTRLTKKRRTGEETSVSIDIAEDGAAVKEEIQPISKDLVTYSNAPRPTWLNLYNLETIRERNKPKQPPKKPEAAPFFLKTLPGVEPKFVAEEKGQDKDLSAASSRIISLASTSIRTEFLVLLERRQYYEALEMLLKMSPSGIDLEVRALNVDMEDPESEGDLERLLLFVEFGLGFGTNYEMVQSFMNLVLRAHGDVIFARPRLAKMVERLKGTERHSWLRLESMFHNSLCLISYFSGTHS